MRYYYCLSLCRLEFDGRQDTEFICIAFAYIDCEFSRLLNKALWTKEKKKKILTTITSMYRYDFVYDYDNMLNQYYTDGREVCVKNNREYLFLL